MSNHPEVEYEPFDNHGSVLNLQGFPGKISMFDCNVTLNMVFIPDIYPSKRSIFGGEDELSLYLDTDFH